MSEETVDQSADQVEQSTDEPAKPDPVETKLKELESEKKALERALSRQGYELGELRKLTDQILKEQNKPQKTDPVDFFADPDKAVEKKIAESPELKKAMELAEIQRKQSMVAQLKAEHPDFKEITHSDDFLEWVSKSKVRRALLQAADQSYDFDAADELLTTWKERQESKAAAAKVIEDKAKADLKEAKVDTGRANTSSGKSWSRIDLMRLKTSDPEKYRSLNVEELYRKGLVR